MLCGEDSGEVSACYTTVGERIPRSHFVRLTKSETQGTCARECAAPIHEVRGNPVVGETTVSPEYTYSSARRMASGPRSEMGGRGVPPGSSVLHQCQPTSWMK